MLISGSQTQSCLAQLLHDVGNCPQSSNISSNQELTAFQNVVVPTIFDYLNSYFPGSPALKTPALPVQRAWVQSWPDRELDPHKHTVAKKKKKKD